MAENGIKILELLSVLEKLKHLKRTGWVMKGISEPESVASHMYRMATLAMALKAENTGANIDKCVQMALIHDVAESIVGDITPHCGVSCQDKFQLEESAMKQIVAYLPKSVGADWLALWHEYELGSTKEANIVKQLDKFDMLAQALTYEEKHNVDLSDFFESTKNSFNTEPFIGWAQEIREKRAMLRGRKQ